MQMICAQNCNIRHSLKIAVENFIESFSMPKMFQIVIKLWALCFSAISWFLLEFFFLHNFIFGRHNLNGFAIAISLSKSFSAVWMFLEDFYVTLTKKTRLIFGWFNDYSSFLFFFLFLFVNFVRWDLVMMRMLLSFLLGRYNQCLAVGLSLSVYKHNRVNMIKKKRHVPTQ